jgi:hypothetical protein
MVSAFARNAILNQEEKKMSDESTFISGMRLTQAEVAALDRYVSMIEQAEKNRLGFINSGQVAFTPGALLAIAVAKFVYEVYQDYGKVALGPEEFQRHFKTIARELAELESMGEESLSLDVYARLRKELMAARQTK